MRYSDMSGAPGGIGTFDVTSRWYARSWASTTGIVGSSSPGTGWSRTPRPASGVASPQVAGGCVPVVLVPGHRREGTVSARRRDGFPPSRRGWPGCGTEPRRAEWFRGCASVNKGALHAVFQAGEVAVGVCGFDAAHGRGDRVLLDRTDSLVTLVDGVSPVPGIDCGPVIENPGSPLLGVRFDGGLGCRAASCGPALWASPL